MGWVLFLPIEAGEIDLIRFVDGALVSLSQIA